MNSTKGKLSESYGIILRKTSTVSEAPCPCPGFLRLITVACTSDCENFTRPRLSCRGRLRLSHPLTNTTFFRTNRLFCLQNFRFPHTTCTASGLRLPLAALCSQFP